MVRIHIIEISTDFGNYSFIIPKRNISRIFCLASVGGMKIQNGYASGGYFSPGVTCALFFE
jgi:hypothetical protein